MSDSKDYQSLVKIEKHPGFFKNPTSQKIYWRGTIKGRAFKRATYTTKITEAKKTIDEFILSLSADNLDRAKRERAGIRNHRIEAVWNELVAARISTKAEATRVVYEKEWRLKLKPFWGELNLSDVTKTKIAEFENWFLATFPGKSFFNTGKCLNMLLNYLHAEGYTSKRYKVRDLEAYIAAKAKKKKPGRVYSDEEVGRLLEHMTGVRGKLALLLLTDTGARKMEVLSARLEHLDLKAKTIELWSDKNKKWRKVPLTLRVVDLAREVLAQGTGSAYLFPMATDPMRHMSGQLFDKDWITAKRGAKIEGRARVHDLRHTFATKTARDGWPIPIACLVLDMSVKVYIKTYVHLDENDIKNWMQKTFDGDRA